VIVMVGSTRSRRLVARLKELGWGRVFVGKATPYPGEPWALDNGAFAAWKSAKPFDAEAFATRASEAVEFAPRFGVLPDVVGAGADSLALSMSWLPRLPQAVPWYLAVQDGMTVEQVAPALEHVAGLFLGGTTEFKATAGTWSALAHKHGRLFHYARASTEQHVRRAIDVRADSLDSTQPLWSDAHWRRFERAIGDNSRQATLWPLPRYEP
jgi:hypothetical protein